MTTWLAEPTTPSRRFRTGARPTLFDLSLSENPFPPLPSIITAVRLRWATGGIAPIG